MERVHSSSFVKLATNFISAWQFIFHYYENRHYHFLCAFFAIHFCLLFICKYQRRLIEINFFFSLQLSFYQLNVSALFSFLSISLIAALIFLLVFTGFNWKTFFIIILYLLFGKRHLQISMLSKSGKKKGETNICPFFPFFIYNYQ